MTNRRVTYTMRPDATPEAERNVLAAVFAFVLSRKNRKAADPTGDRNEVKEVTGNDPRQRVPH